jgi:phage terminase small subunit
MTAKPRKAASGLRPKHQRFVAEYLIDLNATQAAIRAGYSARTAGEIGYELLKKPEIAAAVAKGQQKAIERCEVTRDTIARQLDDDRGLAHKVKQAGAAVSASVAKAKLFGLMREQLEHTGKDGGPIQTVDLSKLTDDQLAKLETILAPSADPGANPGGEDEAGG